MRANELVSGCVVCGPDVAQTKLEVDEAMFRIGKSFLYWLCGSCGTAQIADVPDEMGSYYGQDYYSYKPVTGRVLHPSLQNSVARALLRVNTALYLGTGWGRGIPWARTARMRPGHRVLDIGCGAGENLLRLRAYGYRHLEGADPFLERDHDAAPGVPLRKSFHDDLRGQYDWLIMHHAFEHVPDPRETLRSADRLLYPNGGVLLRLPLIGGWAWRTYGTDWVQMDAPRHLVLFSLVGLRKLAQQEGFVISRVEYDSTAFQMWGSEFVRRGIPHRDGPGSMFSDRQMRDWDEQAAELNAALDGDQAVVVLRRATSPSAAAA